MHNIKDLRKNLDNFKKKLLDRNTEFDAKIFEKLEREGEFRECKERPSKTFLYIKCNFGVNIQET